MNLGHAYPVCWPGKILPRKGGCPKIGLDSRRGMNQNIPNPGVALRWPHHCSLPIEWGSRDCLPNFNLRPRVVPDIQVWLSARDGDERSHSSAEGIMLNSRGEHMKETQEGTEVEQQTPGIIRAGETRGDSSNTHHTTWILHG